MSAKLFASVTIHNKEESDILMQYWKSLGYHNELQYRHEMHSLQVWKDDGAITWGAYDGPAFNDGHDWAADFAGDFDEYVSLVGIEAAPIEVDVEEYL